MRGFEPITERSTSSLNASIEIEPLIPCDEVSLNGIYLTLNTNVHPRLTVDSTPSKLLIGVSRCLLGDGVRFDGGHKHNRYLTDVLGEYFDWMRFCPEVEAGMGTPRPALRLADDGVKLRVVSSDGFDYTDDLDSAFERREPDLRSAGLRGYIFRRGSPSCGLYRVKRYQDGRATRDAQGVFARRVQTLWPNIPCEEGGRLNDMRLRENFIQRVYTYHRWRSFADDTPTLSGLFAFHAEHKYLILAHDQRAARTLGRMVAHAERVTLADTLVEYESQLMTALSRTPSIKSQINTLQHLQGFVKKHMTSRDKNEFERIVHQYRKGVVPLITPLTLLRHHLDRWGSDWARTQVYLSPYPEDLALRSHLTA